MSRLSLIPHRGRLAAATVPALLLLLLSGFFAPSEAQITPPAPGVELPPSYFDVLRNDPHAFQFHHAWIQQTARLRQSRERRLAEGVTGLSAEMQTMVSGNRYVPVLLGKYSNTGAAPITAASLQQELFTGPWPTGTMTQFYSEISYGNINVTGTVYNWVTVASPDTFYEGNAGCYGLSSSCGAHTGNFLKEVLTLNDAAINFGLYDNDGPDGIPNSGDDDGYADFVAFVQPEKGAECGGNRNIWSHRWVYEAWWGAAYTTNDAAAGGGFIKISDYTIQPALSCGGSQIEIGVFCHEFGHAFGLPDLYDTDGSSNGIGQWCLMASGSWGGDGAHPAVPTHMSAWCKEQLGWVIPTVLCSDNPSYSFPAVETNASVLKVYPHGVPDSEYFLVENRQQTGFDTYLRTGGLAVWHIDNDVSGNTNEAHKLVDLEEADGLNHLDAKTNRADAGDLFPGSSGNQNFNDTTNPNARDYAGANTGVALFSISASGSPMSAGVALDDCKIVAWDFAVLDTTGCANGNGFLDAGETAWLRMTVSNVGDAHTGVVGTLAALTPGATVLDGTVSFGTMAAGATVAGGSFYRISLAPGVAAGTVLNFQVAFTGDGGVYNATDTFSFTAGRTILLVDDDEGNSWETFYVGPIANAGYPYRVWSLLAGGPPRPGNLGTSAAVVWFTGQAYDNTLTAADQAMLTNYLNAGGRLFLSGQDIGYDLAATGNSTDQAFYTNVLKSVYVLDDTNDDTMTGVAGDPIGNGLSFSINAGDGANNNTYPSQINTTGGSSAVFQYSAGVYGGVRYAGTGRMVHAPFCFEGISTQANRNLVMSRVLTWLLPADQSPPTATLLTPNGPTPQPACGLVPVTWTAADNVGVTAIDLYYSSDCGASYPHIIATGLANTGLYNWNTPAAIGPGYSVLVVARDAVGQRGCDASNSCFTLEDLNPPVVSVTAPLVGATWPVGQSRDIRWVAADNCAGVDSVAISLSRNGGAGWTVLAPDEANDSLYTWNPVTGPPTDSAMVRVQAFDRGLEGVALSGLFRITDATVPTALVVSPNGGEVWDGGSHHDVRFVVSDENGIDSTCVEYSLNGGAAWIPIACTLDDTLLAWTLPAEGGDSCLVRITAWDPSGNTGTDQSDAFFRIRSLSAVPAVELAELTRPTLFQNRPNPFNPVTTIAFYLPQPAATRLAIYDLQGRVVRTLVSADLPAGYREVLWDGRDDGGRPAPSGVFFSVLEAGAVRDVRKMLITK
jgi:M6 family metalloprotease-like protein